jgi:serine/threonine protein kinase
VLEVVSVLGEGAGGAVQAVRDTRTGSRYARKTIATHEGPLKQLARELAFLAGLRHTHIVRFHGAYMNPSNTEVKLVMELCEGRSLATIGEQIRGRVGEKVARVLAEGVRALSLSLFFSFPFERLLTLRLSPPSRVAFATTTYRSELDFEFAGPARPCVLAL